MQPRILFILLISAALLLAPEPASANAGTLLLWLGMLHLFIGNLIIGIGEGLLLSFLLKTPTPKSILVMILANYLSAWAGQGILSLNSIAMWDPLQRFYFEHTRLSVALILGLLFLVTILIETPFLRWAQRPGGSWSATLRTSLLLQIASYSALVPLYYLSSAAHIGSPWTFAAKPDFSSLAGEVYFLGPYEHGLKRIRLEGPGTIEPLEPLASAEDVYSIFLDPNKAGDYAIKISGYRRGTVCEPADEFEPFEVKIVDPPKGQEKKPGEVCKADRYIPFEIPFKTTVSNEKISKTWLAAFSKVEKRDRGCMGRPFDLSDASNSWQVDWVGSWPIEGVQFSRKDGSDKIGIGVETPPFLWRPGCTILLPGDRAVFNLGPHIVFANLKAKELTWLGIGTSPVVVLRNP